MFSCLISYGGVHCWQYYDGYRFFTTVIYPARLERARIRHKDFALFCAPLPSVVGSRFGVIGQVQEVAASIFGNTRTEHALLWSCLYIEGKEKTGKEES